MRAGYTHRPSDSQANDSHTNKPTKRTAKLVLCFSNRRSNNQPKPASQYHCQRFSNQHTHGYSKLSAHPDSKFVTQRYSQ